MAKKRSKSTQAAVDALNHLLALSFVATVDKNGEYTIIPSQSESGMSYKSGICDAIEAILHNSGSYRGYRYLYGNEPSCKFERQYY